jgi:hypothetical protein
MFMGINEIDKNVKRKQILRKICSKTSENDQKKYS